MRKIFSLFLLNAVFFSFPSYGYAQAVSVEDLLKQIEVLQQQVKALQNEFLRAQGVTTAPETKDATPPTSVFTQDLSVGDVGETVTRLQEALIEEKVYSGPVTGYFGQLTKAGVSAFQEKYEADILKPVGLTEGTGYFGPSTRKKLNALRVATPTPEKKQFPTVTTTTEPTGNKTLSFDGVDDYVLIPYDNSLTLGEQFEISTLVNTSDTSGGILIGHIDTDGAYEQFWYLQVVSDGSGRIEAALGDGKRYSQLLSSVSVTDGAWHKITWKRDGDVQSLFVDGVGITDVNYIDAGITDVTPSLSDITIGGDIESDEYYLAGSIDDVIITTGGTARGVWHFEEAGAAVTDSSGQDNNGVLSGAVRTTF